MLIVPTGSKTSAAAPGCLRKLRKTRLEKELITFCIDVEVQIIAFHGSILSKVALLEPMRRLLRGGARKSRVRGVQAGYAFSMGGRRPEDLEPGETVLWSGHSPLRKRPRWLWVLLLGYVTGLAALGFAWRWGVAIQAGLTTLTFTLADRQWTKATLTRGRYTVTTRRVLVEATWWGRPICRAERLSDLAKPAVSSTRSHVRKPAILPSTWDTRRPSRCPQVIQRSGRTWMPCSRGRTSEIPSSRLRTQLETEPADWTSGLMESCEG